MQKQSRRKQGELPNAFPEIIVHQLPERPNRGRVYRTYMELEHKKGLGKFSEARRKGEGVYWARETNAKKRDREREQTMCLLH